MRVEIVFVQRERDKAKASLTIHPNWLGRLFGRKTKTALVHQAQSYTRGTAWFFSGSGRFVGDSLDAKLDKELDWVEHSELPRAEVKP